MKKRLLLPLFLISSFLSRAQIKPTIKSESAFYTSCSKWFEAWNLLYTDIFGIDTLKPVDFIFFDDKYLYSTSPITLQRGTPIKGPGLLNLKLHWKRAFHRDSILLPDKSVIPVRLMSFAQDAPNDSSSPYFVMPLLSFWRKLGVTSTELGLDNLVTGVFLHEFSHSQQMQNFGRKLTLLEDSNKFGIEFSDDMIQNLFQKDSDYVRLYHKEILYFQESIKNGRLDTAKLRKGLRVMEQRQNHYFRNKFNNLKEIDNFFLTMEGMGQYCMYLWLINPRGGNFDRQSAIRGVRRKRNRWSQDEGLLLFLILEHLAPPKYWVRDMFGKETVNVISLIQLYLNRNSKT